MPASNNPVYRATPCSSRAEAVAVFNNYTLWSIGKFYTVLYRDSANNQTDVQALVAVGVKNASECGVAGEQKEDKWENKYYPNGPKGPEFWSLVFDSGSVDQPGSGSGDDELYTTNVEVNGTTYTVTNESKDQQIDDPFEIREFTAE